VTGGPIADGETLERGEPERPGDHVAVGPEIGGVEQELHERGLSRVLGEITVVEDALGEAPEERPQPGEYRVVGRPVACGERRHGELEPFTLPGVHQTSRSPDRGNRCPSSREQVDRDRTTVAAPAGPGGEASLRSVL